MTKLIHMDSDIRPYLAALMIAALNYHGKILRIPDLLNFQVMPKDQWENMILKMSTKNYNQWGAIGNQLVGPS